MSGKKTLLTALAGLGAVAVASTAVLLAREIYRRPIELVFGMARLSLKARGAREEVQQVGELPMHYYDAGQQGEPVVLVHGLGVTSESWTTLIPHISHTFRVYAPDMPGFGRTPLAPDKQCIATHVEYLGRFLDALGYPQVTLVGQSLGGWIATRYAAAHPERIKRLYLLNSAGLIREGIYSPYTPDLPTARDYVRQVSGYRGPVPIFLLHAFVNTSRRPAFAQFIENYDRAEEVDELLAEISVPTTIIWGTEDKIFPLVCAHDFHAGIPGSRLVLVPGISHNSHIGAARKIARILLEDVDAACASELKA